MVKIPFENGTKTANGYVTIDDTNYPVTDAVYSGNTPLSAANLNQMQANIENAINIQRAVVTVATAIAENTNYTIPVTYIVGKNQLEVIYMGEKLIKDVHYIEVGTVGSSSTIIQFKDWNMSVPVGRIIEFIVRGDGNG